MSVKTSHHSNAGRSAFFVKREGEEGSMEFVSLQAAVSYARSCRDITGMVIVIHDAQGKEFQRIPLIGEEI